MSIVKEYQKCPHCGFEQRAKDVAKDMESVMEIAEKMDYGEPEVQCSNCQKWFDLQCKPQT